MDHLSLRKLSIIILIALSSIAFIHGISSIIVTQQVSEIKNSWSEFRSQNNEKSRLINSLHQVLGYGGMVHNFKNYLLRKDFSDFVRVERSMGAAQGILKQYLALSTSSTEKLVLNDIQIMLDNYQKGILQIRESIDAGESSKEIDQLVKINDNLALRGLRLLQGEITAEHPYFMDRRNKPVLASALYAEFGYGGMIHSFKNYILRQDIQYKNNVLQSIINIENLIKEYKQLNPTISEQTALEDIYSVLTKYRNKIKVIDRNIEQGLTPENIDAKIKINDLYALRGLKAIEQDIIYQIENRTELLGAVIEDVYKKEQLNAIIVISLTIVIGLFIFWVFATKVIRPVKHISNIMLRMSKGEMDVQINPLQDSIDNGNTELGRMHNSLQVFKDNEIKRQIAEAKITRLALTDPLTGLANRNKFQTGLTEMVNLAKREEKLIALLALDLDKFKEVNDEYGHAAGDLVLKAVASNLLLVFRETDMVARLGGDEFSVVLYGPDNLDCVKKTMQRVISLIPTSVPYGKDNLSVEVSIGVALHTYDSIFDYDTLLNNADMALYQAKEQGRNTYHVFTDESKVTEESKLLEEIKS